MRGASKGVQACLKENCPNGLFVHCTNHSLDLCLQEIVRETPLVADALQFVKDASNLVRESPKRKAQYPNLFGMGGNFPDFLRATRWCVRANAIKRVLCAYRELLKLLTELTEDRSVKADTRARIRGLLRQASTSSTYFGVYASATIFSPCEDLAKALQGNGVIAHGAIEAASKLNSLLMKKRDDDHVQEIINAKKGNRAGSPSSERAQNRASATSFPT